MFIETRIPKEVLSSGGAKYGLVESTLRSSGAKESFHPTEL